MSEINSKCLDAFPDWLNSLGGDIRQVLEVLQTADLGEGARKTLIGGLNYSFTSLDLVPDVVADIGYLDDAFVLRLSAKAALESGAGELGQASKGMLEGLASGAELIEELLGEDIYKRLYKYTLDLANKGARGRTVSEIAKNQGVFGAFAEDVGNFIEEYKAPAFSRDEKNLIKLRSFLDAKLPK